MTQVCENGYLGKSGDRFGKVHTQNMVDILFFYYNFFCITSVQFGLTN